MHLTFHRTIFWAHLIAGILAGIVILSMSVTGLMISYEVQLMEWANRDLRVTPPTADAAHLDVEALLARVRETKPDFNPSGITWKSDPAAPVTLSLGREGVFFANPYTGQFLGEQNETWHDFFHAATDWHRFLTGTGLPREVGKAITGAGCLIFGILLLSGIYLWWPRHWRWPNLRAIILFNRKLKGRARDWNWHNVFGFWTSFPMLFIILTGLIMSYGWANNLVFTLTGNVPPPPRERGPGGPGGGGPPGQGGGMREGGGPRGERGAGGPREGGERGPGSPREGGERPAGGSREGGGERGPGAGGEGGQRGPGGPREGGERPVFLADAGGERPIGGGREGGERGAGGSREGAPQGERGAGGPREGGPGREGGGERGGPGAGREGGGGGGFGRPSGPPPSLAGLQPLLIQARSQTPDWVSLSLRMPMKPGDPFPVMLDRGGRGEVHLRTMLNLDVAQSKVSISPDDLQQQNLGRRLRMYSRYLHTGELFGVFGQTIAAICTIAAIMLVWTGFALAWRRFFKKKPPAAA